MNLEIKLLETYEKCENSGLVDRCEKIKSETVLLPLYHTNRKSDGKNIIEVFFDYKGDIDILSSNFVNKDESIIYPVTENSIIRSSNIAAHPLVDEISYILSGEGANKNISYLQELSFWLDNEENSRVKHFLQIVYDFAQREDSLEKICEIIAGSNKYELDKDKLLLYILKEKSEKVDLNKILLTFSVLDAETGDRLSVTKSKLLHNRYIEYVESQNTKKEQSICNLTGKKMYCSDKHRAIMGTAKIISASNHLEAYIGRFDKTDIISIGYNTSYKIHNMLKYLLENKNTCKWLGESVQLMTWFSDDLNNESESDINDPESFPFEYYDEDDDDYIIGGESTKSLFSNITGSRNIDDEMSVYILILDKVSNGRIAINYFQTLPKSDFADNIKYWKDTFSWYFYSKEKNAYVIKTLDNNSIITYLYGIERDGRIGFTDKEKAFKVDLLIKLIRCIVEKKKMPLDFYKKACQNIRMRNKYKNSWNMVSAVACAVINKYYQDIGKERIDKDMLDLEKQSRSYLYGRILFIYDYIEKQALDDKYRYTNAQRFWNSYIQYPKKTFINLERKIQPYKSKIVKSDMNWIYSKIQSNMNECLEALEKINEIENKDMPLNEEFIYGYFAQEREFFKKSEENIG